MRLAIFGGTGATGQLLVQRALAQGHELTVFVRRPDKLMAHPRLRAIEGELSDEERIERAVCDAHAVLSLLGPVSVPRGFTPIADGTKQILRAMRKYGVRRFVAAGTPSMPDEHDVCDWKFRTLVGVVRRAAAGAYHDMRATGDLVRACELDWTLVRAPLLTNGSSTADVYASYVGPSSGLLLSRANLADFMLRQLDSGAWLRRAPMISDAPWPGMGDAAERSVRARSGDAGVAR